MSNLPDYIKHAEKPFPRKIFWKHIAGPKLTEIQKYDIVYDNYDLKIRKIKEIYENEQGIEEIRERRQN